MLELHCHPLASFCWKVLIALYESGTPFRAHLVDLGDAAAAASFRSLWPIGRFPVLRDRERGRTIPESTIIIEHLALHYPGARTLVPDEAELALRTRAADRFYDLYVHEPMQKVVTDRIRPPGSRDPHGVAAAKALLATAYGIVEKDMTDRTWAIGESFTMADCAAAPALFYANEVVPFGDRQVAIAAYLARLKARPSFARVLAEAEPFFRFFPRE